MKKHLILAIAVLALTACGNSEEITKQSLELQDKEATLESRESVLNSKEIELIEQSEVLKSKEASLESREQDIVNKETELATLLVEQEKQVTAEAENELPTEQIVSQQENVQQDTTEIAPPREPYKIVTYGGGDFRDFAAEYNMTLEEFAAVNGYPDIEKMTMLIGQNVLVNND
jgi:hypothetical protein